MGGHGTHCQQIGTISPNLGIDRMCLTFSCHFYFQVDALSFISAFYLIIAEVVIPPTFISNR
jgi:hypothetical protein